MDAMAMDGIEPMDSPALAVEAMAVDVMAVDAMAVKTMAVDATAANATAADKLPGAHILFVSRDST